MAVRIHPAARERLIQIWDYTATQWGEEQADTYVRGLVEALNALGSARHHWRPIVDDALPRVFFVRHAHHYIFFREFPKRALGVISILHENMDIPLRLKEDFQRDQNE